MHRQWIEVKTILISYSIKIFELFAHRNDDTTLVQSLQHFQLCLRLSFFKFNFRKSWKHERFIYKVSHFAGNKTQERISKQWLQENKAHQIFRKTNISYPLIRTRCAYQGIRNVSFSENMACLFFLVTTVLKFALLSYYRRFLKEGAQAMAIMTTELIHNL